MSRFQTQRYLHVKDFDDAVRQSVDLLLESDGGAAEGKIKSFACFGWPNESLGASAVLRAIAKLLKSTMCDDSDTRKPFDRIVHVDCSLWKNKRTMQRAIANELNLCHVKPIFDKQDEEDDFRGVDNSSREQMPGIGSLINKSLRDERFLMIFHYGGIEDIDLAEFGIPFFGKGKLLWTNAGRFFWTKLGAVRLMQTVADIEISLLTSPPTSDTFHRILHEEAVGVIGDTGMDGINPETVLGCFFYSLFLNAQLPEETTGVGYDWATHACNYWICDGILQGDRAWEIANALHGVMPWFSSSQAKQMPFLLDGRSGGWYSVTSNERGSDNISNVPGSASSYFLTFQGDDPVYVRNDLFQLASNLRVLKLCNCSFDFASLPFQSCHNLRFLWLDDCSNTGKEQNGVPIFPNLLVFDLRFTDYVLLPQMVELMTNLRELNTKGVSWKTMSHVWKKLQKLHKLRVTESSDVVTVDSCSSIDMMSLELLDLSGNTHMESSPTLSSARSLKMLVLDGCSSLENVVLEGAPPPLESFSFDGYGPAENWTHSIQLPQKELRLKSPMAPVEIVQVTKISLDGCSKLQHIFLRALPNLEELDLSGTAIKVLDLGAMDVPKLKKLFLLGCQQLHSLIWEEEPELEVLHVDTQVKKRSMVSCGGFHAFIAFTDGRFTWSCIEGIYKQILYGGLSKVYLLVSCMSHTQANITKSIKEICSSQDGSVPTSPLVPYNNIDVTEDVTCLSLVWKHRQLQTLDVHIEIGEGSYNLESMQDHESFGYFLKDVQSLHVHDNSSITAIHMATKKWKNLEWCHVERCPKLHSLFSCREGKGDFLRMKIFSASDLPVVYCIWNRGINIVRFSRRTSYLQQLQHIYLYNCPRLLFVLPISFTLPNLETLQIAYCSNLRHVFPLDDKYPPAIASGVTLKNLKEIKLYHLHNLEQICEVRLTAPVLQTIGIRDCWNLRRLPVVARQRPKPVVDCEKDWWNRLKWDGLHSRHHPSLFETRYSAYYKKTLPRVSFLR